MSVPVGQRTENTLEVLVRADELVAHTVKIMANEKVFDPRGRTPKRVARVLSWRDATHGFKAWRQNARNESCPKRQERPHG